MLFIDNRMRFSDQNFLIYTGEILLQYCENFNKLFSSFWLKHTAK